MPITPSKSSNSVALVKTTGSPSTANRSKTTRVKANASKLSNVSVGRDHTSPPQPEGSLSLERIVAAFEVFAVDESGIRVIPCTMVQSALYRLDLNPPPSRVARAIRAGGYSARGLTMNEFTIVARGCVETATSLDALIDAFEALDADRDGRIPREDCKEFMGNLEPADRVTASDFEEVYDGIDVDRKGYIEVKDFLLRTLVADAAGGRGEGLYTIDDVYDALLRRDYAIDDEIRDWERRRANPDDGAAAAAAEAEAAAAAAAAEAERLRLEAEAREAEEKAKREEEERAKRDKEEKERLEKERLKREEEEAAAKAKKESTEVNAKKTKSKCCCTIC